MMLKERASGMYRLSAFYLARTASDIPSDMTIPSLFIIVACEPEPAESPSPLPGWLRSSGRQAGGWRSPASS